MLDPLPTVNSAADKCPGAQCHYYAAFLEELRAGAGRQDGTAGVSSSLRPIVAHTRRGAPQSTLPHTLPATKTAERIQSALGKKQATFIMSEHLPVCARKRVCAKVHIVHQQMACEFRQVQVLLPTRSDQAVEALGQQRTPKHSCYSNYQALLVPTGTDTIAVRGCKEGQTFKSIHRKVQLR